MQPALTALIDDEPQPDFTALARDLVALLFAAAVPLEVAEVQRLLDLTPQHTERVLRRLADEPPLGLRVQRFEDRLQLTTTPAAAPTIERFLGAPPPVRLSRAALEALAVVAYRQPVTRGDIDAVRGVNSDSAVTTLLSRNLVVEVGRKDTVGRPALLAVTTECLQYLGISSLTELPPLPDGSLPTAAMPAALTSDEPTESVAPNGKVHERLEQTTEAHELSPEAHERSAEARELSAEPERLAEVD